MLSRKVLQQRLKTISILLVDPDHTLAHVTASMLRGAGFLNVHHNDNLDAAMERLSGEEIDIVITESRLGRPHGLTRELRRSPVSPNRFAPVIQLSALALRKDVEEARDAGANHFIAKPFPARTLLNSLGIMIYKPEPFVWSPEYKGPDRRRRQVGVRINRRRDELSTASRRALEIGEVHGACILPPDYTLRQKVGFDMPVENVINADAVKQAEHAVAQLRNSFREALAEDCRMMNKLTNQLITGDISAADGISSLRDIALNIKARAGTFGYDCASQVAESLYEYSTYALLELHFEPVVFSKHIESLHTILEHNIIGDAGNTGMELLNNLRRLVQKYNSLL